MKTTGKIARDQQELSIWATGAHNDGIGTVDEAVDSTFADRGGVGFHV